MTLGFALYWFARAERGSEASGNGDVVAPAALATTSPNRGTLENGKAGKGGNLFRLKAFSLETFFV